jgi:PLP dependent protein
MARLIDVLDAGRVGEAVQRVREEIAGAARRVRRDPAEVELLAAVKYVALEQLGILADVGLELVGENRAQDLEAKAAAYPGAFRWHFIGQLQSRKVKVILPHVELIHSVASDSALGQLGTHGTPDTEVLVEVNVAREEGKAGVLPDDLAGFLERSPVRVVGLMTMPPFTEDPEASRPHFAALRELASEHGLRHLSMGTSQDYAVAVEEGATIVRVGSVLYGCSKEHNAGESRPGANS